MAKETEAQDSPALEAIRVELQALGREIQGMKVDLAAIKEATALQAKLGVSTKEAAFLTSIGEDELRKRALSPETSPHHVKVVRIGESGRKLVFPRSELERLLRE